MALGRTGLAVCLVLTALLHPLPGGCVRRLPAGMLTATTHCCCGSELQASIWRQPARLAGVLLQLPGGLPATGRRDGAPRVCRSHGPRIRRAGWAAAEPMCRQWRPAEGAASALPSPPASQAAGSPLGRNGVSVACRSSGKVFVHPALHRRGHCCHTGSHAGAGCGERGRVWSGHSRQCAQQL